MADGSTEDPQTLEVKHQQAVTSAVSSMQTSMANERLADVNTKAELKDLASPQVYENQSFTYNEQLGYKAVGLLSVSQIGKKRSAKFSLIATLITLLVIIVILTIAFTK